MLLHSVTRSSGLAQGSAAISRHWQEKEGTHRHEPSAPIRQNQRDSHSQFSLAGTPAPERGSGSHTRNGGKTGARCAAGAARPGLDYIGEEAAARELNTMRRALSRGMLPQQKLGLAAPIPGRKQVRSPFARMRDIEVTAWTWRYKPWASSEAVREICKSTRLSRLELTRRVVEGNQRCADIARIFAIENAKVLDKLRQSLDLYCALKRAKKQLT